MGQVQQSRNFTTHQMHRAGGGKGKSSANMNTALVRCYSIRGHWRSAILIVIHFGASLGKVAEEMYAIPPQDILSLHLCRRVPSNTLLPYLPQVIISVSAAVCRGQKIRFTSFNKDGFVTSLQSFIYDCFCQFVTFLCCTIMTTFLTPAGQMSGSLVTIKREKNK